VLLDGGHCDAGLWDRVQQCFQQILAVCADVGRELGEGSSPADVLRPVLRPTVGPGPLPREKFM
jgi:hypothetical protein